MVEVWLAKHQENNTRKAAEEFAPMIQYACFEVKQYKNISVSFEIPGGTPLVISVNDATPQVEKALRRLAELWQEDREITQASF